MSTNITQALESTKIQNSEVEQNQLLLKIEQHEAEAKAIADNFYLECSKLEQEILTDFLLKTENEKSFHLLGVSRARNIMKDHLKNFLERLQQFKNDILNLQKDHTLSQNPMLQDLKSTYEFLNSNAKLSVLAAIDQLIFQFKERVETTKETDFYPAINVFLSSTRYCFESDKALTLAHKQKFINLVDDLKAFVDSLEYRKKLFVKDEILISTLKVITKELKKLRSKIAELEEWLRKDQFNVKSLELAVANLEEDIDMIFEDKFLEDIIRQAEIIDAFIMHNNITKENTFLSNHEITKCFSKMKKALKYAEIFRLNNDCIEKVTAILKIPAPNQNYYHNDFPVNVNPPVNVYGPENLNLPLHRNRPINENPLILPAFSHLSNALQTKASSAKGKNVNHKQMA